MQPHSGSQANMAVYLTMLNPGDKVLGLDLAHGGHLTHGSKVNFSGQFYNFVSYGLDKNTGRVNFDNVLKIAKEHKLKVVNSLSSYIPFDLHNLATVDLLNPSDLAIEPYPRCANLIFLISSS